MNGDTNNSEIVNFYRDKTILITGGTGFVGRVLVEHLLRKCGVRKIYILVRKKKGVDVEDRKESTFNVPLFEKLKTCNPNFIELIHFIRGDIMKDDLGIDEFYRTILCDEVNIVFNAAATVKLNENLKVATFANVRGTKELCRLSSKFRYLEAFVHVSTAYSNAHRNEIDEVIYETPITPDNLIRISESLSEEQISGITANLIGEWPNTYCFTKAAAENVLKSYSGVMRMCIVRPGLIISTKSDPIKGWIDNMYGPIGFITGTAAGLLRVSNVDPEAKTEFVPADMVVSTMIAAGCRTGTQRDVNDVTVYHLTTDPENPITYREFNQISMAVGHENPPHTMMWYLTHTIIKNRLLYLIAMYLVHLFPAALIDGYRQLRGKKPKALELYRRAHYFLDSVSFVSTQSWTFGNKNLLRLKESLSETDRKMFDFDLSASNVNWREIIVSATHGATFYLLKIDLTKSTESTKRKQFWFHILHRIVQLLFLMVLYWSLKVFLMSTLFLGQLALANARLMLCPTLENQF